MENKQYDSVLVAKKMLVRADERDITLNSTQLQKLLFIVYGLCLSRYDYAPFTESPKAWPFGPVFPRVNTKIKHHDYKHDESVKNTQLDALLNDIIEEVLTKYGNISATKLSAWSHQPGSPWAITTNEGDYIKSQEIPDKIISDYFKKFSE